MDYESFIARKFGAVPSAGFDPPSLIDGLFPFQRDLARWAIRRGRAAIFANTGLGKTRMQIAWAEAVRRHTGGDVLILAPLAVVRQTVAEGEAVGVAITACRDGADVRPGINAANYDRLHRFDPSRFVAVVLDESSCIKHHDAKTLATLIEAFAATPYRLACTATPAPNDWTELGTHAEFLGVCRRVEMLSEFFVHDGGDTATWRLKGHARGPFWRWVASWGALVSHPKDLGYDGDGYDLPTLDVRQHVVPSPVTPGSLFATDAATLSERRAARRDSIARRVAVAADIVNAEPSEPWIVWCDLNDESDALTDAITDAVEVRGSTDRDDKERAMIDFAEGRVRVLVTKPSICGFGLNWQHCARVVFVGVTDSWEAYYQAVRRCWRFGQTRPVVVHVVTSESEGAVVANLARKDAEAATLSASLAAETAAVVRDFVRGNVRTSNVYAPSCALEIPSWLK
jgi:superfamily II DNA or RNA helicase